MDGSDAAATLANVVTATQHSGLEDRRHNFASAWIYSRCRHTTSYTSYTSNTFSSPLRVHC